MFYDMQCEIRAVSAPENIYSLCGMDADGKLMAAITYYTDDDNAGEKQISVDFGRSGDFEAYLVDEEHTNEKTALSGGMVLNLRPNSIVLIKEK